jgi:hypothetical protein
MSTPTNIAELQHQIQTILLDRGFGPHSPAAHRIWLGRLQSHPASCLNEVQRAGDTLTWLYDTAEFYILEGWTDSRRTAQRFVNQFAG